MSRPDPITPQGHQGSAVSGTHPQSPAKLRSDRQHCWGPLLTAMGGTVQWRPRQSQLMASAAHGNGAFLSYLTGLAIIKCYNFKQSANPTSSLTVTITISLLIKYFCRAGVTPGCCYAGRGEQGAAQLLSSTLHLPRLNSNQI